MILRDYQQGALDAVLRYWSEGGGNPLIDMATGLGKSVVVANLARLIETYPQMRVLILVHVQELVEQNYRALIRMWPQAPAGIYSAGLGRRDAHHQITFASIQSVYRKARALGPRDLVLVDEAHLVPASGAGMYLTLFSALRDMRPDMRVAGLTATAFRLDSGRLDRGEGRLFDETVYHYGVGEGVDDGWLAPLTCRAASIEIDVSDVARRGGEFVAGALEAAADRDDLTRAAVTEIVKRGQDRRSWLVFCSGVKHAAHVCQAIQAAGFTAGVVTGETPKHDRARMIEDFKAGRLRALTNAQVLTTGFDAPQTDLIAFLRPTLSTGLYVQMLGRGTRPVYPPGFDPNAATQAERVEAIAASTKPNCLVLDFAGNVRRHGPVDAVVTSDKKKRAGEEDDLEVKAKVDSVRAKECPNCMTLLGLAALSCPTCGFEFPAPEPKHEAKPDEEIALLSRDMKPAPVLEYPVVNWTAQRHEKIGSPPSMRVTFYAGLAAYSEWICFEHAGFARHKAWKWWLEHGGAAPEPVTIDEALQRFATLRRPDAIFVKREGRFDEIVARRFKTEEAA